MIKVPNSSLRIIIDRLARIIVYEGSGFENALIEREANNPLFAFLSIVICYKYNFSTSRHVMNKNIINGEYTL